MIFCTVSQSTAKSYGNRPVSLLDLRLWWVGSFTGVSIVILRCMLDGLLLPAVLRAAIPPIVVYDGDESFLLEAVEALYYELVEATDDERRLVQQHYRLLKVAGDYRRIAA